MMSAAAITNACLKVDRGIVCEGPSRVRVVGETLGDELTFPLPG